MVTMIGQHTIRNYYWIPKYLLDVDLYTKDVFPSRFLREDLRTEKVLLLINNNMDRELSDENNQDDVHKQLRSLVSDSHTIAEISQKWEQNRKVYPYTALKENSGIGSNVKVMSNYSFKENSGIGSNVKAMPDYSFGDTDYPTLMLGAPFIDANETGHLVFK
jgi:hypothetical protein